MVDFNRIREQVERAIDDSVAARMEDLRKDVTRRVLLEMQPVLDAAEGPTRSELLNGAVAAVHEVTSQADILKAMLDGATNFSARCGLLVVRGMTATGWQARGFAYDDAFKTLTLDCSQGVAARAIDRRVWASAPIDEFNTAFAERFGAPADEMISVFPLVIKEKVAALLYADGGSEGAEKLDSFALELLVRTTGLWVELLSLRRGAGVEPAPQTVAPTAVPVSAPVASAPARPAPVAAPVTTPAQAAVATPPAVAAPVVASSAAPQASEDELHNKARRFAKLLVDEIKLYNLPKVKEGREHRDLYDRLKDDIDKSRATYEKRYGQTVTDVDYFRQELVRLLADNDVSLLGGNFPQR